MTRTHLSLIHSGPTLTLNKALGQHWSKTAPIIAQWREDFGWLGKTTRVKIGFLIGVEVRVWQRQKGALADAAGHYLLAKAAVDGLVDAGVLREDDGAHVAWTRCHAPTVDLKVPVGLVRIEVALVDP